MHFKTETIVGIFILAALALFLYMNFQLGSLRFDALQHTSYTFYCEDAAGITPKSDIKIAGVRVGWVDSIELLPEMHVKMNLRIVKSCTLHVGMHAVIRQEGLLGAKYLEFIPHADKGAVIKPGEVLPYPLRPFVSMDELFYTFQKIGSHIESLGAVSKNLSTLGQDLIKDIKETLGAMNGLLARLSNSAASCTESVTTTADALRETASTLNKTLMHAQEPVQHISKLTQELQKDKSLIEDVKCTAKFARSCVQRARNCAIALDTHFEVLPREHQRTNVKGYFDVWLFPCSSLFCLVGPVYSHLGFAKHKYELCNFECLRRIEEKRDSFALNLQVGARLPCNFQVRAGLFQSTAGFGIDWCLPFNCFQWVTTFEAFDFKGHTRFAHDCRPYLKWLNRLYINDAIYIDFGANDFISKCYKSGFIGLGATFSTCNLWCR